MSHETTPLQAAVSAYLRAHLKREGRLPTAEEIAGQLRRVSADIVNASLACALPGRQPAPASDPGQSGTRSTRSPTSRQLAILGFIQDHVALVGYAPSIREIAGHFGIASPNGVVCHLRALERRGYLLRDRKRSRAIVLPRETHTSPDAA
jgi:SOS-response transcriptional repressor LexA